MFLTNDFSSSLFNTNYKGVSTWSPDPSAAYDHLKTTIVWLYIFTYVSGLFIASPYGPKTSVSIGSCFYSSENKLWLYWPLLDATNLPYTYQAAPGLGISPPSKLIYSTISQNSLFDIDMLEIYSQCNILVIWSHHLWKIAIGVVCVGGRETRAIQKESTNHTNSSRHNWIYFNLIQRSVIQSISIYLLQKSSFFDGKYNLTRHS